MSAGVVAAHYVDGTPGGTLAVRSSSTVYTESNTVAVTIPATAVAGDLLVVSLADSWGSNNVPTGWTRIINDQGSNMNGAVFYKVCVASEPGSTVNFTIGGSHQATAICVAIQGSHQGAALSMWEVRSTSGGSLVSASHSAADKDLLLHFGHWRSAPANGTADKGALVAQRTDGLGRASAYAQPVSGSISQSVAWTLASSNGYFYATMKVKAVGN